MVRDVSLHQAAQEILSLVMQYMSADSCLLYMIDSGELVLYASHDPADENVGRLRLKSGEGLTGWVGHEKRLLAITAEAYADPRFRAFSELPQDSFEAFLAAPVFNRSGVVGVINIQHRRAHQHTGSEMEMLTTVGEQIGCLLALDRLPARMEAFDSPLLDPSPIGATLK